MVHITYRHGSDSTEENQMILKESQFYISDDQTHDFHYVQHCFQLFYDRLVTRGTQFHQHWIWLDGCAGQFKNAHVFQWLYLLHIKYNVPHLWSYFESGHGRGEHDGAGACIKKTALRREQMKFIGTSLQDAESIVRWCTTMTGDQSTRKSHVQRVFWEFTNVDCSHTYRVNTVQGTRGFHSIRSSYNSALEIWTRKMSCFCGSCSIVEWDECELSEWVDTWNRVKLGTDMSLVNEITPLEENETRIFMDYDHISDLVKPGTNFFI